MITFTPAFRVTEVAATGDITEHLDEGVVGYLPSAPTRLDATTLELRDLSGEERRDLVDWSRRQGRALSQLTVEIVTECRWPAALTREEMDALALADALWARDRLLAFDAEQAEVERAVHAGELEFD